MEVLKVKNSLKKTIVSIDLVEKIIEKLSKLQNLRQVRLSIELTEYIANLVENSVTEKFTKDEKQDLILQVVEKLYVCGSDERDIVKSQITFLLDNDRVKKISWRKYVKHYLKSFFPKF
jgi:hypothetical protein